MDKEEIRKKIRIHAKMNENGTTIHQNLWDDAYNQCLEIYSYTSL